MPRRAPRNTQDIPSAQNFSPSEIDLPTLLELVAAHEGRPHELNEAIRQTFYADRTIPGAKQGKVWENVAAGMVRYGLIDQARRFTPLGQELYRLRADPDALYRRLAQHLLFHLNGAALIECLLDMQRAGERPDLPSIREALEERGIHTSRAGKSISLLGLWLGQARLFRSRWVPNVERYHELVGRTEPELGALAALTPAQRAVMRMLASLGPGRYDSSDLRQRTEVAYQVELHEKQFPQQVLHHLRDLGYITLTKKGGRGWSQEVVPTPALEADVTIPLLDQLSTLPATLRTLLRMDLPSIIAELDSDRYTKGAALEALAFKLMKIVGLAYISTRFRPTAGRFEVDLIFHSERLAYSRWQVQCKNTQRVAVDDVAKEVGLTYHLLSNVIIMLTRGRVGNDARRYASDVMRKTNLAIALIDGADVADIIDDPLRVFDVLAREAAFALSLKPLATTALDVATECPKCAEQVDSSASFCPHCGHRLHGVAALLAAEGPPAPDAWSDVAD